MQSAFQKWALQAGLLVVSCAAAGVLAEGLSRVVVNRVDYLAVDPVYDPVLGLRLMPHASGHDAWGFRNREVPDSADVVTIGDSQTYGISAPASRSWPAQLAKLSHRRVYNLALGGYGPVQYQELLRTKGLALRPAVIVVGLYYGNDLRDAYRSVYGLSHWAALRQPGFPLVSDSVPVPPARDVFLGSVRDWLARHSVVYRLASFTALGGFARGLEFSTQDHPGDVVVFRHPLTGARTGLTPLMRLEALNLDDRTVMEGLRVSLNQLEEMADECRSAGVHFVVALIPTKEKVFEPWLANDDTIPEHDTIRALLQSESEVNRRVRDRLGRLGIRYVDLEPALRDAAARGAIYPSNDDGHPNGDGYAVIAQAIAKAIRDWQPESHESHP